MQTQPSWTCFRLAGCVLLCACLPAISVAHPISMSDAVVDVREKSVQVDLQVMVEDLVLYRELKAGEDNLIPKPTLIAASEGHKKFVSEGFHVIGEDGKRLVGKITSVDTSRIPKTGVPLADIKSITITYVLTYRLDSPAKFITVMQQFGGKDAVLPAIMDCTILQSGVLLDRPEPLSSGQTRSTGFDWENPPKAARSFRELREQRQKRTSARLGIASYSGLYSFIYITEHEVRHEILVPLLTLEKWVPIARKTPDVLTVREQAAASRRIEAFFRSRNPVKIDGLRVRPVLSRLSFFGLDINDFAMNAKPRQVNVYQARAGIILSYSTKGWPESFEMVWETFSRYASFLRSVILVGEDEPEIHMFVEDDATFHWKADPKRHAAAAPLKPVSESLKRDVISEKEATSIASALIKNVYRAFDYKADGDIYDALEQSVSGDLLRKLYLQIKRSLVVAEQGGAKARVKKVSVSEVEVLSQSTGKFTIDATWRVSGTVEHWGHIHTRENEYRAQLTVMTTAKGWKIEALQFRGQKRIQFQMKLRTGS